MRGIKNIFIIIHNFLLLLLIKNNNPLVSDFINCCPKQKHFIPLLLYSIKFAQISSSLRNYLRNFLLHSL